MSNTILITGARAPVALDAARAARAAGYRVHLADSVSAHAARALRPPFTFHRLPPPRQQFTAFRAAILALLKETDADHVLPTCEEIFWLAEAAWRDGWSDRLIAPDRDLLRTLHSKALFPALAKSLGIAAPETLMLDAVVDSATLPWPLADLVLKPEFSRFATETLVAPSAKQYARIHPSLTRRWVAQRRIVGEEICTWATAYKGNITAFAAYRPRWRQGRAAAFMMEAIDAPAARAISETIATASGMTGQLAFDIIVDTSGIAHPIECNPRSVSGLHLFDASADVARALIEGLPCPDPVPGTLRHLGPAMALLGVPVALRQGRWSAFLSDWRQSRDIINRAGHTGVTLGCLADASGFAFNAWRSGQSPAAATTADIAWDGEAMA